MTEHEHHEPRPEPKLAEQLENKFGEIMQAQLHSDDQTYVAIERGWEVGYVKSFEGQLYMIYRPTMDAEHNKGSFDVLEQLPATLPDGTPYNIARHYRITADDETFEVMKTNNSEHPFAQVKVNPAYAQRLVNTVASGHVMSREQLQ